MAAAGSARAVSDDGGTVVHASAAESGAYTGRASQIGSSGSEGERREQESACGERLGVPKGGPWLFETFFRRANFRFAVSFRTAEWGTVSTARCVELPAKLAVIVRLCYRAGVWGNCGEGGGPIANRPQVANLPHKAA